MVIGGFAGTGTAFAGAPAAATGAASAVTATTATLNGTCHPNKESTTYRFEYGTTTAYGSQTAAGHAGRQRVQGRLGQRLRARGVDDLPLPPHRDEPVGLGDGRGRAVHDDRRRAPRR